MCEGDSIPLRRQRNHALARVPSTRTKRKRNDKNVNQLHIFLSVNLLCVRFNQQWRKMCNLCRICLGARFTWKISISECILSYFIYFSVVGLFLSFTSYVGSATCQRPRLRTDCTFSHTHTHSHTYVRSIGWTMIAFEPSVRTRCFASKWANKEYFPFSILSLSGHYCRRHDNRIHRLYCLRPRRKEKCEWVEKRPISLSSLFNVMLPSTST